MFLLVYYVYDTCQHYIMGCLMLLLRYVTETTQSVCTSSECVCVCVCARVHAHACVCMCVCVCSTYSLYSLDFFVASDESIP